MLRKKIHVKQGGARRMRTVILMASKASPSETLAWSVRAAQARHVAGMLSPEMLNWQRHML
jgi:hypothetical protein